MPRQPRYLEQSGMFHLIGRANADEVLFRDKTDFHYFEYILCRYLSQAPFFVHHYVIMNNHYHLLIWVENTKPLSQTVKALQLAYFHYFKKKYGYKGHLWHGRYRSIFIEKESHWVQCARYIELNPVHAGLCQNAGEYRWSSYAHYAFGERNKLLRPIMSEQVFEQGRTDREYQRFVANGMDRAYQRLKKRYQLGF